jgi:hypothetical protein
LPLFSLLFALAFFCLFYLITDRITSLALLAKLSGLLGSGLISSGLPGEEIVFEVFYLFL